MSRLNWKGSTPYEQIIGAGSGKKIYSLMEYLGVKEHNKALRFAVDFAYQELIEKSFKPAEPERKKGKWLWDEEEDRCYCSECGEEDDLHSVGWLQEHDRILTESVEPERKTGRWIDGDGKDTFIHCSVCYEEAYWDCHHCGAKLDWSE